MNMKQAVAAMAVILTVGAMAADAATRSTNTSERAYVLTNSKVIDGVCYDSARQEMTVFFHAGTAYVYSEVPAWVFQEFVRAESPGHYYHEHLRGQYAARRLTEGELMALVDRHDGATSW